MRELITLEDAIETVYDSSTGICHYVFLKGGLRHTVSVPLHELDRHPHDIDGRKLRRAVVLAAMAKRFDGAPDPIAGKD